MTDDDVTTATLYERVPYPGTPGAIGFAPGGPAGDLVLTRPNSGKSWHFDPFVSPPPPPGNPTLPATVTLPPAAGITLSSWDFVPIPGRTADFTHGLPSFMYAYARDPGPGTNQGWSPARLGFPGDGTVTLESMVDPSTGRISQGGLGFIGSAGVPLPALALWAYKYAEVVVNGVVYGLWWTATGGGTELDMTEGWLGHSYTTFHDWAAGNLTVGPELLQNLLAGMAGQWVYFAALAVAGPQGGMATYVGASWTTLGLSGAITGAQMEAAHGVSIDDAPHIFDIAQEAEGQVDTSVLPTTDTLGCLGLFQVAA